jgi:hypothetical protein
MEIDAVLDGVNIDILMVWHTYCLNPSAYEEDTDRLGRIGTPFPSPLRGLNALGAFPLTQIVSLDTLTKSRCETDSLVSAHRPRNIRLPAVQARARQPE